MQPRRLYFPSFIAYNTLMKVLLRNLLVFFSVFLPLLLIAALYALLSLRIEYGALFTFRLGLLEIALFIGRYLFAFAVILSVVAVMLVAGFRKFRGRVALVVTFALISFFCALYPLFVSVYLIPRFETIVDARFKPPSIRYPTGGFYAYGENNALALKLEKTDRAESDYERIIAVKREGKTQIYISRSGTHADANINLTNVYRYEPESGAQSFARSYTLSVPETRASFPALETLFGIPLVMQFEKIFVRYIKGGLLANVPLPLAIVIAAVFMFFLLTGCYMLSSALAGDRLNFVNALVVLIVYLAVSILAVLFGPKILSAALVTKSTFPILLGIGGSALVMLNTFAILLNHFLGVAKHYSKQSPSS